MKPCLWCGKPIDAAEFSKYRTERLYHPVCYAQRNRERSKTLRRLERSGRHVVKHRAGPACRPLIGRALDELRIDLLVYARMEAGARIMGSRDSSSENWRVGEGWPKLSRPEYDCGRAMEETP